MVTRVEHIESFDAPELQPYKTMRRQLEHREAGIFVAEGEKVVRRLLDTKLTVVSVLLPEKWYMELEPVLRAREDGIRVYVAEKKVLETLTGFSMYQGLLAVARVPELPSVGELLARTGASPCFVAVDGLSSAQNLGVVARSCAGLGVDGLIVGETCVSPFLRRAVRSSMGAVFEIPVVESPSLVGSLRELRGAGVRCIAAHPQAGSRWLSEVNLRGACCLVFGSEGYGLGEGVLRECDTAAVVPMEPQVDSLNVGSAAAIFLYEMRRQRGRS